MKEIFISLCSGLLGVVLTIGYQHFFSQPQSLVVYYNGEEVTVTQSEFIELDENNKALQERIAALENENAKLQSINTGLLKENSQYTEELNATPVIAYNNLGLVLDAEDISINKNNSMITVNGRNYFSKEITEKLLPDNKSLTVKGDTIFVGTVVENKASLLSKKEMSSRYCTTGESLTDSYGNTYSNTLRFDASGNIIYVLNGEYSLMKFTISIHESAEIDEEGIITIKADDDVVYTSPSLNKKTEAYTETDVPINNCKLITIEYSTDSWSNDCILSDVVVYN